MPPARLLQLAIHVDYRDGRGWPDAFSQAKFSDCQRQYGRRRGRRFVFTPQFPRDGRNYQRPLLLQDIAGKAAAINRSPPRADIALAQILERQIDTRINVRVDTAADRRDARVFMALSENNLATAVKTGENGGAVTRHDFVVRELAGPIAFDHDDGGRLHHDVSIILEPR